MDRRIPSLLVRILALSLILVGCTPSFPQSKPSTPTMQPAVKDLSAEVRDQVITFIQETSQISPQNVPSNELEWTKEESKSPASQGGVTSLYKAGDWEVQVTPTSTKALQTIYLVTVTNPSSGLYWQGRVDEGGNVLEQTMIH